MGDLQARLANRVQLTTDGHRAYLRAVEKTFGIDVDYAQLVKIYGAATESAKGRYSPEECVAAKKERIVGRPDMAHASTSYVERQNLTMRIFMRHLTRLTNAISKNLRGHCDALALYFFTTTGAASTKRFASPQPWPLACPPPCWIGRRSWTRLMLLTPLNRAAPTSRVEKP